MIHTNSNIHLTVRDNLPDQDGCRHIVFDRPAGFTFEAGDWIDIQFEPADLKGGKTYSLSSSPTESYLMISFKDGVSQIKQRLAALSPGDTALVPQYGNDYKFTLRPHQSSVLIAGGVGIAPFRSMLKEMVDTGDKNDVELIYLNKTPQFLFGDLLDAWQKQLPGLTMHKLVTGGLKRKDRNKLLLSLLDIHSGSFYIAGPEDMVEQTEHLLLDAGVELRDIKIDSFGGY